jgi:hypothetical protein
LFPFSYALLSFTTKALRHQEELWNHRCTQGCKAATKKKSRRGSVTTDFTDFGKRRKTRRRKETFFATDAHG